MLDAEEIAPEELLASGTLLAERYRVDRVLGRGGMGVVYSGRHERVGRSVAIKVLSRDWSRKAAFRRRFEAEVWAAGAAGHPNIVEVLDVGELPDGRLFSVMERVDGIDLLALTRAEHPLLVPRVVDLLRGIAHGLRAAHERGIIHRDLKPENVMVRALPEGEVVKILDFGIASGVTAPGPDGSRMTRPGVAIGTPEYMAPEQVDGDDPSPRFDIYAFGVLGFELLTQRLPLEDDIAMRLMARKCNEPARRVDELRPDVPPALADLLDRCLRIDPRERPQSIDEVLLELEGIRADVRGLASAAAPVDAPARVPTKVAARTSADSDSAPEAPSMHPGPPRRSRRVALGFGGAAVLLGLSGVVWVATRGSAAVSPTVEVPVGGAAGSSSAAADAAEHRASTVPSETAARVDTPAEGETNVEPSAPPASAAASEGSPELPPTPSPGASPGERDGAHVPASHSTTATGSSARPEPRREPDAARCAAVRARAEDARRAHDWAALLRSAQDTSCWRSAKRERIKELTRAYMELGRFSECAKTGRRSSDPDVQRWTTLCERRAG